MGEALDLKKETEGATELQFLERRLKRCWWTLVAILLLLSLLGFLGKGYYSTTTVSASDGSFSVEYEWIARYRATLEVKINVKERAIEDGEIICEFERSFLELLTPSLFMPLPIRTVSVGNDVRYYFSSEHQDATIIAQLEADRWGRIHGSLRCSDSESIPLSILILP